MPLAIRLRGTAFGRAYTQRRLRGVAGEVMWQIRCVRENVRRAQLRRLDEAKRGELAAKLAESDSGFDVKISVMCLSRRIGNRDSNLPRMLNGLLATADRPDCIEVLVKVDLDDDLPYYLRLKRRYSGKLALCIIATERRRGPADMHHFYEQLLAHCAPSAGIVFIASDDGVFVHRGWDADVLAARKDAVSDLFVGGELPFEQVVSLQGPVQAPLAPRLLYQYRVNNYPFISIPLLRLIGETVQCMKGWTPFGSSMGVDLFVSAVIATVWEEYSVSIYIQRDRLIERTGVVSYLFTPERDRTRTETLMDIMSATHRGVRQQIAERIIHVRDMEAYARVEPAAGRRPA